MFIDWTRFVSILFHALGSGAEQRAITSIKWDVSMGCDNPYEVVLESFPPSDPVNPVQHAAPGEVRWIYMDTPCRKCNRCGINRKRLWQKRAAYEIHRSPRTWLLTLTIAPEWRFRFSLEAGSMDYFASYKVISKQMTLYWKRLRKAKHVFRYMMAAEAHKSGYPHIHALVHEVSAPIPKRILQEEWPFGFTHAKLVSNGPKAAWYVSKYLSKDMRTRVRASQYYGKSIMWSEDPLDFLGALMKYEPLGHSDLQEREYMISNHQRRI